MIASEDTLIQHDVEGAFEFPPNFNQDDLEWRASIAHRELEASLRRPLKFEGVIYNQDASFSVAIRLSETPGSFATYACDLRFSNYGDMVAVTDDRYEGSAECARVFEIAERLGFVAVHHSILDRPYDGINGTCFDTWWTRYFDWL